jgi:hypothetical protein
MKTTILLSILFLTQTAMAQTTVKKTIAVQAGQKINMHFDYPNLIRVSTWDKNEISIQGTVSINGGENDDAFDLQNSTSGNIVTIKNEIRDFKNLPHRITITNGAQKITFKNKDELRKYQQANGIGTPDVMCTGVDMDIVLEIKVPGNTETRVESVYGMVEVKSFTGPITVDATYGGVDAALLERSTGELIAETNYGQIYTNLDVKFSSDKSKMEDFHTFVSVKPGAGPRYNFGSKYGNVYIRKAN